MKISLLYWNNFVGSLCALLLSFYFIVIKTNVISKGKTHFKYNYAVLICLLLIWWGAWKVVCIFCLLSDRIQKREYTFFCYVCCCCCCCCCFLVVFFSLSLYVLRDVRIPVVSKRRRKEGYKQNNSQTETKKKKKKKEIRAFKSLTK